MSARARALSLVADVREASDFREAELLLGQAQVYAEIARADAADRQSQAVRDASVALVRVARDISAWLADDMARTAGGGDDS